MEVCNENVDLPEDLLMAWSRLDSSPAEALRDLAGAVSCAVEPNRSYALQWEADASWDDLGPLRKALVAAAVVWLAGVRTGDS